jgi:hypothetical protein
VAPNIAASGGDPNKCDPAWSIGKSNQRRFLDGHAMTSGLGPQKQCLRASVGNLLSTCAIDYAQHGEESMRGAPAIEPSRSGLAPVRAVFRAVVVTVVPDAKQLDESSWLVLEELVEDALEIQPPALRGQLRLFLRAIAWLPVLRYGRTFTALGDEQRSRVLRYLQDHPVERIRCGFWGLRTLAFLGYYGRLEGAHAIGYAPNPRGWSAVR